MKIGYPVQKLWHFLAQKSGKKKVFQLFLDILEFLL
jgi:hypothetical protein